MKSERNNCFPKKGNFVLLKVVLWIFMGILYMGVSILIPSTSQNIYKELLLFLVLILSVYFNTSYLYSKFYKKNKVSYALLLSGTILGCMLLEISMFYKEYLTLTHTFGSANKVYAVILVFIFIRNLALFLFFLWIEYLNQLIVFYDKNEKIHHKEMALLIEKQEFEKQFSRKKLLSHFFFNIIEHFSASCLLNHKEKTADVELLDKLKFVLYYFLVDAEKDKTELNKELAFYKYYIDLEKFRKNNRIEIDLKVLGKPDDYTIIPLLFEPLIGNALKHTKHDGTGRIDIVVDATCFPKLVFRCKNNFCYSSANIVSSENGLKILQQRLDLCYTNKYTLDITQKDDLYDVTLLIDTE